MRAVAVVLGFSLCLGSAWGAPRQGPSDSGEFEGLCNVVTERERFLDKPIRLRAVAHVYYGGTLLKSDECEAQPVALQYMHGYEKGSDARAVETLNRLERHARRAALSGNERAGQSKAEVVLEGRLEKNAHYKLKIDRGDKTLAYWDYNYEYAFVLTRVVSLRVP